VFAFAILFFATFIKTEVLFLGEKDGNIQEEFAKIKNGPPIEEKIKLYERITNGISLLEEDQKMHLAYFIGTVSPNLLQDDRFDLHLREATLSLIENPKESNPVSYLQFIHKLIAIGPAEEYENLGGIHLDLLMNVTEEFNNYFEQNEIQIFASQLELENREGHLVEDEEMKKDLKTNVEYVNNFVKGFMDDFSKYVNNNSIPPMRLLETENVEPHLNGDEEKKKELTLEHEKKVTKGFKDDFQKYINSNSLPPMLLLATGNLASISKSFANERKRKMFTETEQDLFDYAIRLLNQEESSDEEQLETSGMHFSKVMNLNLSQKLKSRCSEKGCDIMRRPPYPFPYPKPTL